MEKISRSVHQAKQAKFLDVDCTCLYSPYSPYGDVAGPYRPYGGDVANVDWSILGESNVDMCHWVANNRRTRGPIQGCHVSLTGWLRSLCIKCWRPRGSTPGPLLHIVPLQIPITNFPTDVPCYGSQCASI
jgi:hypothetical protein